MNPTESLTEERRLASFKSWPYADDAICNKKKMAEAGFYKPKDFPDDEISAACYVCGKVMHEWDINDDPWQEHIDHAPNCKFVQIGKPEEELTLEENIILALEHNILQVKNAQEKVTEIIKRKMSELQTKIQMC